MVACRWMETAPPSTGFLEAYNYRRSTLRRRLVRFVLLKKLYSSLNQEPIMMMMMMMLVLLALVSSHSQILEKNCYRNGPLPLCRCPYKKHMKRF